MLFDLESIYQKFEKTWLKRKQIYFFQQVFNFLSEK